MLDSPAENCSLFSRSLPVKLVRPSVASPFMNFGNLGFGPVIVLSAQQNVSFFVFLIFVFVWFFRLALYDDLQANLIEVENITLCQLSYVRVDIYLNIFRR